jgi:hypothetical protein
VHSAATESLAHPWLAHKQTANTICHRSFLREV